MARKTIGVSLNDADEFDAWLLDRLEQEQSVSNVLREALRIYYTGEAQRADPIMALTEAVREQTQMLVNAIRERPIVVSGMMATQQEGNGHDEQGGLMDRNDPLVRNLINVDFTNFEQ